LFGGQVVRLPLLKGAREPAPQDCWGIRFFIQLPFLSTLISLTQNSSLKYTPRNGQQAVP